VVLLPALEKKLWKDQTFSFQLTYLYCNTFCV